MAGSEQVPTRVTDVDAAPNDNRPENWFETDSKDTKKLPEVARKKRSRSIRKTHQRHQFTIAVCLIVLYGLAFAALVVGWFAKIPELSTMTAVVASFGTLVAAVVAFYFASNDSSSK